MEFIAVGERRSRWSSEGANNVAFLCIGKATPDNAVKANAHPGAVLIVRRRRTAFRLYSYKIHSNKNQGDVVGFQRRQSDLNLSWLTKTIACDAVSLSLGSRSFENSYIPENPRTPKPLTFSKNRLRGAKNRSNTSPVAKQNSGKTTFFFRNFAYLHICTQKKVAHMQKLKKISFFRKKISANCNDYERFGGSRSRFFDRNNESRSFENSYIPENPRTPKPLTFSKNRLRGAKNRSNISPVAKNFFRKNDFFFSKNFAYVQSFFVCICAQSLYNTYLKRFVKKNLKKNAKKKKLHICTKNKKKLHICKRFRSRFFERNNGLGDIGNWGKLIYSGEPENSPNFLYLPNRYSFQKTDFGTFQNLFFRKKKFAAGLIFERFLAPRSRFFEKVNERERESGYFENLYWPENFQTVNFFEKNDFEG
ncbi:hypothetical protein LXL04_024351 [Taraxacum kok-saghyz]